jgi:YVTN family beta-propeller protein
MDKISNASEEVLSLKVGWNPVALSVDYRRGKVYVVNYGSDKLSVLDIVKTVKGVTTGAVSTINDVGDYLTGIVTDPVFDRFYLLKESPGEIVIIKPIKGSLEFDETMSPPVMGVIPVGELPKTMILGPDLRRLYVINRGTNTISVVNKTTKKEEQIIAVGNKPYGIALFQN